MESPTRNFRISPYSEGDLKKEHLNWKLLTIIKVPSVLVWLL